MKKNFKFIVLAMLLCVGFVFAGCGSQLDSQVKVNIGNEEDYVACTEETSFMAAMENMETTEETTFSTIKFTLKADMEIPTGIGNATMDVDVLANVMIEMNEENIGIGAKVTATVADEKQTYEVYYKDGYLYLNDGETKSKVEASTILGGESGETPSIDMSGLTDSLMSAIQDYTIQKVDVDGNITRYMFALAEGQNFYIILKDNTISQIYADFEDYDLATLIAAISPELASEIPTMAMDMTVGMEFSANGIDYPSFDSYTEQSLPSIQ